ncbi:MAG TPA: secretin N-terminal domain-containing protein [Thermoanaerobaculia bacterium]|nr:secretin N-terminal domain-containing protein [Thermoanaerobaculia bacterium]
MMNRLRTTLALLLIAGCASYNAYEKGRSAERMKNWDEAVVQYTRALDIDSDNMRYQMNLQRAKLEASRVHFEKGKTLEAAAFSAKGEEKLRLAQLAATELEVTVKLDTTNQFAAVEYGKTVAMLQDIHRAAVENISIEELKKRAEKTNITKSQPPQLEPTSSQPITLTFPRDTPVKDIYRALGNAFGINVLFDQAVKDDRVSIELRDVTAQQALERVMQAANHFYKVLDEHTIIIVPDNPQARRDYEDLVIRTFYLSNGDAEQVTNVVRTMIEARNVFPLKALNAITIRDTADKVRIAEKIIEANDKAKAEVVVDVELLQLDLDKTRDLGFVINGYGSTSPGVVQPLAPGTSTAGGNVALTQGTLADLRRLNSGLISFSIPNASYAALKSLGNTQLLANPELRISEGEKATLHIGSRIPVPVSTFTSVSTTTSGTFAPVTSYQYQDVGIKVSMEPRVHHNREVTLKLTVDVSNLGAPVVVAGQPPQPTFATRTIESTIRLKDGETNFLAGLIQQNDEQSDSKTPFLGDLPVIGRLFTNNHKHTLRTDLVMTMTPHIIRIPNITEDDLAPMWVGTQSNLSFRGLSPRIESQSAIDPFAPRSAVQFSRRDAVTGLPLAPDGEPGNVMRPLPAPAQGAPPRNPFPQPPPQNPPTVQPQSENNDRVVAPRISPQPARLSFKPGEEKLWSVVGMDLDGLTAQQLSLRYDPQAIDVSEVTFGPAIRFDPKTPPVVTINRELGKVTIAASDGKPLSFNGGGDIATLRVRGGGTGESFLVMENPTLTNGRGEVVVSEVAGGRAKVE